MPFGNGAPKTKIFHRHERSVKRVKNCSAMKLCTLEKCSFCVLYVCLFTTLCIIYHCPNPTAVDVFHSSPFSNPSTTIPRSELEAAPFLSVGMLNAFRWLNENLTFLFFSFLSSTSISDTKIIWKLYLSHQKTITTHASLVDLSPTLKISFFTHNSMWRHAGFCARNFKTWGNEVLLKSEVRLTVPWSLKAIEHAPGAVRIWDA